MRSALNRLVLSAAVVSGCVAAGANAATISVTDGSFENPDPTHAAGAWANLDLAWDNGPASGLEYEQNNGDNITARTGSWSVFLSNAGSISQSLTTSVNVGDTLSVTFWGGKADTP